MALQGAILCTPQSTRARVEATEGKLTCAEACCKYCSKGIACGDTCIAANRSCHNGPGCAC